MRKQFHNNFARALSDVQFAMLLLPIVERELRVASRSGRMYLGRVTTGIAALGLALYLVWLARYALGAGMAGMFILKSTSYLAWALCVFGGVNRTCDSLSAEKRGDTLGLLFLTHLKGYDVVLGKLLASGLTAILLLLGVVPILSIPVMMGGVAANEIVRIPVALFNSLFLALSVGLFASALFRHQRAAASFAGGVIVFLTVLLPALAQLTEREFQLPEVARCIRVLSPLCSQEMAFTSAFGLSTNDFWKSIVLQFGMGLAALFGSCRVIPYTWKIQASSGPLQRWRERFNHWTHGTAAARIARRTRFLTRNPWFWLEYRDRFAPLWPAIFALIIIGATAGCIVHYEIPKPPACALLFAAIAVNDLTVRMRVASMSATRLAQDRQSGALEMILSTPLSVREIVKGQWLAIRKVQLRTYCALMLLYFLVAKMFMHEMESTADQWWVVCSFALISLGDFVVIGYVAMWKGMRVSDPRHGAGSAMVRVLIVPWFVWLGLLPLINQIPALRKIFDSAEPYSYLIAGLTVWGISSVTALVSARKNLQKHFREAATDRYLFEQRFKTFWQFKRRKRAKVSANFEQVHAGAI